MGKGETGLNLDHTLSGINEDLALARWCTP